VVKELEKPEVFYDDDDNIQGEDEEEETQKRLSKKARKAANKLSIAELKAIVRKPEIVEWTDTSAQDPKLLVNIKSARNVVPVPNHWSLKREYLSSKRGIEKPGFALPQFIAETGISDMRDAVLEKQAEASLKQRQRERVQPKMGKLDIDYQKLYEAFFRRQTKPQLTRYGEVYYEGKEYETNLRHLRPGELSEELKEALNMPPGAPPPWLINQQKVGPPPSYPAMKIPGLNAPPPLGGQWGFHPGGYGKPPLDEQNRPLWGGDVFGMGDAVANGDTQEKDEEKARIEAVDKTLWGELQPLQEEEEEEEDEEDEDDEEDEGEGGAGGKSGAAEDVGTGGIQTPWGGTETPGGFVSTVPTEFGTQSMAEEFNLRKQRRGTETEESHHPRSAGQVLQERNIRAEGFFGGERAYDLGQKAGASNVPVLGERDADRGRKRKAGDLDVSVDVDALERDDRLSKDEVRRQYEAQRTQQQSGAWKGGVVDQEDLSAMIAEEHAKRRRKDEDRAARRR
jgi:splicing factor 3B subunit 2